MTASDHRTARAALALLASALLVVAPGASAGAQPSSGPTPSGTNQVQAGEATAAGRAVVGDGHVDMGPRFVDGGWRLQIRDDTVRPSVWRNLPDVVLQVVDGARLRVPEDPRFGFLGKPGVDVWVLPQVQQPGILWAGWNTQDPAVATGVEREITWTLRGVNGPGRFVLFLNGNFGEPQTVFDSGQPLPQRTGVEVDTHVHGNWVFTAAGSYLLDVEMTGRKKTGETLTSRGALRLFVGTGDPTGAFNLAAPDAAPTTSSAGPAVTRASDDGGRSVTPWLAAGAAVPLALIAWWLLVRRRRTAPTDPTTEA